MEVRALRRGTIFILYLLRCKPIGSLLATTPEDSDDEEEASSEVNGVSDDGTPDEDFPDLPLIIEMALSNAVIVEH